MQVLSALWGTLLWVLDLHVGTAAFLEILWSLIGVAGMGLTWYLRDQSRMDLRTLEHWPSFQKGGPRHIIARGNLRATTRRLQLFGMIVGIGVLALLSPAPAAGQTSPRALLFSLLLLAGNVVLVRDAVQDRHDQGQLLEIFKKLERLQKEQRAEGRRYTDKESLF